MTPSSKHVSLRCPQFSAIPTIFPSLSYLLQGLWIFSYNRKYFLEFISYQKWETTRLYWEGMYISWKMGASESYFFGKEGNNSPKWLLGICWLHSFNVKCLTALDIWIFHSLWKFIIMWGTHCLYFPCVRGASLPDSLSSQNCCLRSLYSRVELPWKAWMESWSHPKPQFITAVTIDNSLLRSLSCAL